MAFLDHIAACNSHDLSKFRPFLVEERQVGWVRHDVARMLAGHGAVFRVDEDAVRLSDALETPDERSAAVDAACRALQASHRTPALRGERYDVSARWGEAPLMTVDRGVVTLFGIRAYGVHVNGAVGPDRLWVAKRAVDKAVAPGKLDNLIAGGQPSGLGLMENLVKEAAEEADIPEGLARTARPVGAITYCQEDAWGLKPDTMFCYDLEVPEGFEPRNTDGEIESFRLMKVADVLACVRDTMDFKFNVNLVLMDFFVRRGWLCPDSEPDYVEIVKGLRKDMPAG